MVKATGHDIDMLARTVWGEARGEKMLGKVAVAWTVRNRHAAGRWFSGDTIAETCRKPRQFSCWNPTDPNRVRILEVTLDDPDLQDCLFAAVAVVRDQAPDPTRGATHYHAATIDAPGWARGHRSCAVIGRHIFYNDVR